MLTGMSNTSDIQQFSQHRLRGESLTSDLTIILANRDALYERTGITLSSDPDWQPWADNSYLTANDLANPDIAANIKAIAAILKLISFVAATEDNEYFGYWHGLTERSAADSPIVYFDNEGQFHLCSGQTLIDAILENYVDDAEDFADWKSWLASIGIEIAYNSVDSMPDSDVDDDLTPDMLHKKLYYQFLGQ